MFLLQFFFLFLFGLLVGTFGTMLGVGGGFIHVPFFMLVFHFIPQDAIGTSIGIIFFNTLAGATVYYFQKKMDFELAKKLSLATIPGALIGPLIVQRYTHSFFALCLAIMLLFVAYSLYFKREKASVIEKAGSAEGEGEGAEDHSYSVNLPLGFIGTLLIGFLSNLFGVGGGIIHVPFLILGLKIPVHIALGTSHFILCFSSFLGTLMFLYLGNVQVDFMMPVALGSIVGARIGAELSGQVSGTLIRKILAFGLLFVALRLLLSSLAAY
ncbi:MAG: sulfite exporter TauE/SafE family protein [Oligoflexia bacterium]|nr:sulfite exporter TauE/SafE family protein [Oligoflexia bacterium]MBF0365846.1 sulfite exporter TauE/SafE family protein [Oligoflexia bacterium]